MSIKKIIYIFLLLSLIGLALGIFLLKFYDCGYSISCYNLIDTSKALIYGTVALASVFLFLIFIPNAFQVWKKFAKWFIPLVALLFIFYPEPGSGDFFSPYPEQVFRWVSILYVIISVLIIAINFFKSRKLADN